MFRCDRLTGVDPFGSAPRTANQHFMATAQTPPALNDETQLDLFKEYHLGPAHLSRVLPVWDLLPLFLYARRTELPGETPVSQIPAMRTEFQSRGEFFTVDVKPAILRNDPKAPARIVFPGEREQLVSAALRALAVRQKAEMGTRYDKQAGLLVTVAFSIRQLRTELAATGHTFSHAEVVESLQILAGAIATIDRSRENQEPIRLSTPYFYSFMSQGEKYIVTLNPMESQQILAGAFRALDYAQFMELPDPLARWIFQYLHSEHLGACRPGTEGAGRGFQITLDLLFVRGMIAKTRRVRDVIPRVRSSLDLLAGAGVLHVTDRSPGYDEQLITCATKGRQQITGAVWTLYVSDRTAGMIIDANVEAKPRRAEFKHLPTEQRLAHSAQARASLAKRGREV